jgi:hypothetical protein
MDSMCEVMKVLLVIKFPFFWPGEKGTRMLFELFEPWEEK